MKASERLRKAAADPTLLLEHGNYFWPASHLTVSERERGVRCRVCAVGAMVACCESEAVIERVYKKVRPTEFFSVVDVLAPHLVGSDVELDCPLEEDHRDVAVEFRNYGRDISHLVEHLFEDHDLDLVEIADLIEPMGY